MTRDAVKLAEVDKVDQRLIVSQQSYFKEISERFGVVFDPYAGEKDGVDTAAQWHVIAYDGGEIVGCGSLRDLGNGVSEVKRVWVANSARGEGIASMLMDWLEAKAKAADFTAVRLDTNGTLIEAQALYAKRGYVEIDRYNDNPFAEHFYEKRLTSLKTP